MTAETKPVGVSFLSGRAGGDKVPTTAREGDSHVTQGDARIPLLRPLTARHHVGEDDTGVYVTAELSVQDRSDEQKLFRAGIQSLGQPVKWHVAVPTDAGPAPGPGLADALASLRHQKTSRQVVAVAHELLPLFDAHPEVKTELARLAGGRR